MKKHYIFIDESGQSDPKTYKNSPVFTVCAIVVGQTSREKMQKEFDNLKRKYFGKEEYILHGVNLKRHLKNHKNVSDFARDLSVFLKANAFFILYITTYKEKAYRLGWDKIKIVNNSYRILIGNLIKFLIAKDLCGQICCEASYVEQDIILYKNFFHFQANGIDRLNISSVDVKRHLTSLNFVTKLNNDSEQQIADLYGICPKLIFLLKKEKIKVDDIGDVENVLLKSLEKKLFKGSATKANKTRLYKEINPNVIVP